MLSTVRTVHLLFLGLWLGATVFFSLVVAPTLFTSFPTQEAGQVMSALFPSYYRFGYVCGASLVATSLFLWRRTDLSAPWLPLSALAALMLFTTLYAGAFLQPRAHELRAELHGTASAPEARVEFDQIHRRSVQLNGAVIVGNLLMVGLVAWRRRP